MSEGQDQIQGYQTKKKNSKEKKIVADCKKPMIKQSNGVFTLGGTGVMNSSQLLKTSHTCSEYISTVPKITPGGKNAHGSNLCFSTHGKVVLKNTCSILPELEQRQEINGLYYSGLPRSKQDKILCLFPAFFTFSLCFFIDKKNKIL